MSEKKRYVLEVFEGSRLTPSTHIEFEEPEQSDEEISGKSIEEVKNTLAKHGVERFVRG